MPVICGAHAILNIRCASSYIIIILTHTVAYQHQPQIPFSHSFIPKMKLFQPVCMCAEIFNFNYFGMKRIFRIFATVKLRIYDCVEGKAMLCYAQHHFRVISLLVWTKKQPLSIILIISAYDLLNNLI